MNLIQLRESFKDTDIFSKLGNKKSHEYKFIVSPFVADFPIGSGLEEPPAATTTVPKV